MGMRGGDAVGKGDRAGSLAGRVKGLRGWALGEGDPNSLDPSANALPRAQGRPPGVPAEGDTAPPGRQSWMHPGRGRVRIGLPRPDYLTRGKGDRQGSFIDSAG